MTNTKSTPTTKNQVTKHTPEAEALADAILKAAGSGLRHYSMSKTREAIFAATQQGLDAARMEMLAVLDKARSRLLWARDLAEKAANLVMLGAVPK